MPAKINLKKIVLSQFKHLHQKIPQRALFLAVSGGLDSSVLAHILLSLKDDLPPLHFLHVNYHLRPESDAEAAHLTAWAKREGILFDGKSLFPENKPKNLQAWARSERYFFFAEILQKYAANTVWLAHHQDDQVETIFLKLLRGQGLKTLSGMQKLTQLQHVGQTPLAQSLHLFRPLLAVPKIALKAYAEKYKLPYFEDSSNLGLDYQRNRLRRQILPLLQQENANFNQNLLAVAQQSREAQLTLTRLAKRWIKRHARTCEHGASLPRLPLAKLPAALRQQVLLIWIQQALPHYRHLSALMASLASALGRPGAEQGFRLEHPWELRLNGEELRLARNLDLARSFREGKKWE